MVEEKNTKDALNVDDIPEIEIDDMGEIIVPERVYIPGYEKRLSKIIITLTWIPVCCILIMLGTTLYDVIIRATLNLALPGAYEYSKFLMVFIAAVALPYAALNNGHVEVDMIARRLPPPIRKAIYMFNYIIVAAYSILLTRQNWLQAGLTKQMMIKSPDTPFTLYQYPFYYVIAIGTALLLVVVLVKAINYMRGVN